jgi:hypothetical protein
MFVACDLCTSGIDWSHVSESLNEPSSIEQMVSRCVESKLQVSVMMVRATKHGVRTATDCDRRDCE